jgi:MoxR-like ATPase
MFNLWVDYPSLSEEQQIVKSTTSAAEAKVSKILSGAQIIELQNLIRRVPVADNVVEYAVKLVRKTRPASSDAPQYIKDYVSWGCGPRASQYLVLGGKTRAALDGRPTPEIEDIRAVALPVLRHRLVTSFNAEADGVKVEQLVEKLLGS